MAFTGAASDRLSQTGGPAAPGARGAFVAFWVVGVLAGVWRVWRGDLSFTSPSTLVILPAMLACTICLLRLLPLPIPKQEQTVRSSRAGLVLVALGLLLTLSILATVVQRGLLLAFPPAGLLALVVTRADVRGRELFYALVLGLVAGAAGTAFGDRFSGVYPVSWAVLQLPLVLFCLPAGWVILRRMGYLEQGLGRSVLLERGLGPGLAATGRGIVLAIPWALLNVTLGGGSGDQWLDRWWQPLAALQPGIAEEAWARVFLVALLFAALRLFGRARLALTLAVLVAGYWFAYLHSPIGLGGTVSALLAGHALQPTPVVSLAEPGAGGGDGFSLLRGLCALCVRLLTERGPLVPRLDNGPYLPVESQAGAVANPRRRR